MNNQPVMKQIVVEVPIEAPKEKLWKIMIDEISQWWPKDFLGVPDSGGIRLEAWPGGRLYELAENGAGLLWATVVMVMPGEAIEFSGTITPTFGGISQNSHRLEVRADGEGKSIFRLQHAVLGNFEEEGQANVEAGWQYLFGEGLKKYVEAAP